MGLGYSPPKIMDVLELGREAARDSETCIEAHAAGARVKERLEDSCPKS